MKKKLPNSKQFQDNIDNGKQNIFFLGPSGVGKTRWQKSIIKGDIGFKGIELDSRIGNNKIMLKFLEKLEGKDEAEKMGNAFGKPWENPKKYKLIELQSLKAEKEEMNKLALELSKNQGKYIVDLTGSAIYCTSELKKVLKYGISVYLSVDESHYNDMLKKYLENPKPLFWDLIIEDWEKAVIKGNPEKQLPKLFKKLLNHRHKLYSKYADIILPWNIHKKIADIDNPQSFIDEIKKLLNK